MEKYSRTTLPIARGEKILLLGESGSGKTKVLERIYREEGEVWDGNVIFVCSPSRVRDNSPRFVLKKRGRSNSRAMDELSSIMEGREGSSGSESAEVLFSLYETGVIDDGSLLLFDSLDAFMDTTVLSRLYSFIAREAEERDIAIVASISSPLSLRNAEIHLSPHKCFWCSRGEEEEKSEEEIFRMLLSSLEGL